MAEYVRFVGQGNLFPGEFFSKEKMGPKQTEWMAEFQNWSPCQLLNRNIHNKFYQRKPDLRKTGKEDATLTCLLNGQTRTTAKMFKWNTIYSETHIDGECPRSVMVKAIDCGIVVSEFVLQSRYYVHFRANTLGKGMNPLILLGMG